MHTKTFLHACCVHTHHRPHNLLSPVRLCKTHSTSDINSNMPSNATSNANRTQRITENWNGKIKKQKMTPNIQMKLLFLLMGVMMIKTKDFKIHVSALNHNTLQQRKKWKNSDLVQCDACNHWFHEFCVSWDNILC